MSRGLLAIALRDVGRADEAVDQFRIVVDVESRGSGRKRRGTFLSRGHLAKMLWAAGRPDESIVEFERLLSDMTRALGPDDDDTELTRQLLDEVRESRQATSGPSA